MGVTNEFERDLNDQSGLKRPGRVDLRVFQNTPDAGDGHPGLQKCFRNYLHEGGMEKDLDLVGYGIKGDSVDINNVELQQLSNIGGTTISGAQWVFVGEADQTVKQADSPTFGGLTVNGNITIIGTIDGVDVGDLKTAFDNHKASTGADHSYINKDVTSSGTPNFQRVIVGASESSNFIVTMSNYYPSDPTGILLLDFTNDSTIGTGVKFIRFDNKDGEVGAIHSEVVYGTFTGSHDSQTKAVDLDDWEIGMIVIANGKLIGKPSMGRALPECDLSRKEKDKRVFGVYSGIEKKHNKKGFDKKKPSLYVNALGEGQILVTDTNGNIAVGDYIQSSGIHGLGEKQDDDILHNYTVAKATQPVNWNRIKAKNGIKKKLIACTYHCG